MTHTYTGWKAAAILLALAIALSLVSVGLWSLVFAMSR